MKPGEYKIFLKSFFKSPQRTGAIAPSSRIMAREMVRQSGVSAGATVVEYGPGTGSFTAEIIRQLGDSGRLIALEANEDFVSFLRRKYPQVEFIHGDVLRVQEVLRDRGIEEVDAVISGLPFANLDRRTQRDILRQTIEILRAGGRFVTFQYHHSLPFPAARRFRRLLKQTFSSYDHSAVVRNLPPALILRATKT